MFRRTGTTTGRRRGLPLGRIVIALIVAGISLFTYFSSRVDNPVTGETQHIGITVEQEIALGLQAAPEMAQQFGGLHPDQSGQALVDEVGNRIVASSPAGQSPYEFDFHLLADDQTINAFALPGGQIFITAGLFEQLRTEGELAGILGHEIGHVVGRHSAEQIAKAQLTEGLTGAVVIASYDPENPSSQQTAQMAMLIGQVINMKYGRDDELESDWLGVCFIADAGYDPRDLIGVMEILAAASEGQGRQPEFFSTHPNPDRRIERIQEAVQNLENCP